MVAAEEHDPCVVCEELVEDHLTGPERCSFLDGRVEWVCMAGMWAVARSEQKRQLLHDRSPAEVEAIETGMLSANDRIPMEVRERRMVEVGLAFSAWDEENEPPSPWL